MKLPVSAREVARFTPTGCESMDPAPVYLIATPSGMDRARMRHQIAEEGAHYWTDADLFGALRRACDELFAPAEADEKRSVVQAFEEAQIDAVRAAWQLAQVDEDAPEDRRKPLIDACAETAKAVSQAEGPYRELERLAIREVPAFAAMLADRKLWLELAPYVAARMFLRGWENLDLPFKKIGGFVAEECLDALDARHPGHVEAIGWAAIDRQQLSEQAAKN